jgi:hypothetical protein
MYATIQIAINNTPDDTEWTKAFLEMCERERNKDSDESTP